MIIFVAALIVNLFITLVGEFGIPHRQRSGRHAPRTKSATAATATISGGAAIGLGHVVPLVLLVLAFTIGDAGLLPAVAGVAAIVGLYLYEYVFVMAPQDIPNS